MVARRGYTEPRNRHSEDTLTILADILDNRQRGVVLVIQRVPVVVIDIGYDRSGTRLAKQVIVFIGILR